MCPHVDTSTTILGRPAAMPLVFAPTGFTRLMHHDGELAVARVAGELGIPYALSTLGTTSPEDLAAAAADTDKWFQLYLWNDRDAGVELVRRALGLPASRPSSSPSTRLSRALGCATCTTDSRSRRRYRFETIGDIAIHPGWWFNKLTTEPLRFAAFSQTQGTVADLINRVFDPTITFADLGWLRDEWEGPIVIKGIQTVADAEAVVDAGMDADRGSPTTAAGSSTGRLLPWNSCPAIAQAVGDRAEVYVDGGVLNGADIVAGVALGAGAVLVGRAYLYGLMAGGERGVARAGELLRQELVRTMQLWAWRASPISTPGECSLRAD